MSRKATARWAVSVESLPVPARAAVLKSLQARLGLALLPEDCGPAAPLALLLHRLRALSRAPPGHSLWAGSWLLAVPQDPLLWRLHRDLAAAVAGRLLPGGGEGVRHLMVCLQTSPDEALEALLAGADGRDVGLEALRHAQRCIEDEHGGSCSPFEVEIVRVECPCFAADNPATLAKVLDLACAGCHRLVNGA